MKQTHGLPMGIQKPLPKPSKTLTPDRGRGFPGVGVQLKYPRVTPDNP